MMLVTNTCCVIAKRLGAVDPALEAVVERRAHMDIGDALPFEDARVGEHFEPDDGRRVALPNGGALLDPA